jgi:PBSX family phage terminase large subunit
MASEVRVKLDFSKINPKQERFLEAEKKYIGFGGARGGGKSWVVRMKAVLLALRFEGIKVLIVRRTYPELKKNHIDELRRMCLGIAKYNDKDKVLNFINGSKIFFTYCACDKDLDMLQGAEFDVIFLEEAGLLSEFQMKSIVACLRGVNDFPKRVYFTMNPGGQGHAYLKRIFIDRKYLPDEKAEEYEFIQSLVTDNLALMESQPDYIEQLKKLPAKLKKAWLEGDWDIFEGMFFEEFRDMPENYDSRQWTHVIEPFDPHGMRIYRSYDFGYNKPWSCGWWAVDHDGVIYRILELYGCTGEPNEGDKKTPDEQFAAISKMEREHPYLKGKKIEGVADPSIWDRSRGVSVEETARKYGVYFTPGDNSRLPGWMQCHYRLRFDENGYPMMYVFNTCKDFIRTIPMLMYSQTKVEDIDTEQEDHIADEWRYFCMSKPMKPIIPKVAGEQTADPLDRGKRPRKSIYF